MSHYIYETASIKFGQILDVTEKNGLNSGESNGGTVEITFTSQTQSAYVGSSSVSGRTNLQGNVWYTGASYARYSGSTYTNETAFTSGVSLDWQNSNMLVIVKDKSGKRLWSADYTYKGGWEMSGFAVNTSTEASKLCINRLVKQFRSDYKI